MLISFNHRGKYGVRQQSLTVLCWCSLIMQQAVQTQARSHTPWPFNPDTPLMNASPLSHAPLWLIRDWAGWGRARGATNTRKHTHKTCNVRVKLGVPIRGKHSLQVNTQQAEMLSQSGMSEKETERETEIESESQRETDRERQKDLYRPNSIQKFLTSLVYFRGQILGWVKPLVSPLQSWLGCFLLTDDCGKLRKTFSFTSSSLV